MDPHVRSRFARSRSEEHRHPAAHRLGRGRRRRPAAAIRRAAARPPTSSRRCSSPRCGSIRRIRSIPAAIASCCRKGTPRRCSTPPGPKPARSIAPSCSKLRELDSDLEGHPTPRLPFVDVATGSLGQGICAAVGIALNARRIKSDYRTYCLLGDGESAEGSVWEAADVAADGRPRQPVRHHRRQRARPEPADDVAARPRAVRAPLARLRLARDRHRRPRHERDPRRLRRGARAPRAGRR